MGADPGDFAFLTQSLENPQQIQLDAQHEPD